MSQKLVITKQGRNVIEETNPGNILFSSDYNTLKYKASGEENLQFDASTDDIAASSIVTHSLGYYPYVEAYVDVYTGATPSGEYEYCPFSGSGATIFYTATFNIRLNEIRFYGEIIGTSSSVWHFDFIYFIFKNEIEF